MNPRYVPSTHPMPNPMQMMAEVIPEQNYPNSIDANYSRKMYQVSGIPSDHSLRPNHLPVNYDCGYLSDMSYQTRLSPVYEQSSISSLFDLQDNTRMQNGYTEPELCEGLTRGLNIHKSNFPPNNPSKISQSGVLQKAQRDLDWKLKSRLSADDLISKGILLGREQSPHILQNKIRLERAKTVDLLKKKILARPPKGKLIDGNILKEFSGSPRLHQCQMSILKKQIMKQLNEKISERPRPHALIKKGILCPPAPTLNECLQRLENARNTEELMTAQHNLAQLRSNPEFYKNQNFQFSLSQSFNQSPASVPGYDMSREETGHPMLEQESSPDCSIVEESITCQDNSALDTFTVSSKFPSQQDSDIASRRLSHSKRISVRNPPNESTLKKDLISSSSLKTRSGKKPRKNIKTYKYHEYIPCPHSGNGLTKNKILEKTHLHKTALSESKERNKNNLDMEVQQEQLLLQLHLLRQQYPSLMPNIYNELVSQLSQIDGKEALAKRRYTLEELDSMTVTSLKQLCKEHSLPSTGKKAELVTRLTACNRVIIKKEDLTENIGSPDSISKFEVENKKYLETGGRLPKESDEQTKAKQSINSLDSVPDQINAAISSPLSEISQYSAPSSDSYGDNGTNAQCDEVTSLPDPDHGMLLNEFDSLPGVDAVKYLESSFNSVPNRMFIPESSYNNIQCEYQPRNPGDGVNTKKQLFKYQSGNIGLNSSSSLPNINGYQQNLPPIPPNFSNQDRAVSDLLRELNSFGEYGMDLNRSLPTYQPRSNPNQSYEDQYYPGLQAQYNYDNCRMTLKPMELDSNSYLDTPFPGDLSCPAYTSDMSMEYNTPIAPNDLFPLNDFHYNNEFAHIDAFDDIYHNSIHNSIDCDI